VGAAMETARPGATAKGIDLDLVEASGELVLGDPDRLQQVLWNLLSNAVKFTPRGGKIKVSVGRVGTTVRVKVSDTGDGVAPDFLPHVFERFRQAESGPARKYQGLGLGLAIVRQLVELHGGEVSAHSPGKGQGATFVVSLPVPALAAVPPGTEQAEEAEGAEQLEAREAWTAAQPALLRGLRVLVVEDDPDGRGLVTTVMEQCGADVTAVASAAEALLEFERAPPEIVVSDIGLPGQDGYALIREIRKRAPEEGGRIPALALTAFATSADREEALAAGYQEHLIKPAKPADLVAAVASLTGRTRHS